MKKIIIALLGALVIGGILFMSEQTYGFCGSKCKHPVYTKDNFIIIEKEITTTTSTQSIQESIQYPEGLNKDNTFILSARYNADGSWRTQYVTTYGASPDFMFSSTISVMNSDSHLVIMGRLPSLEIGTKVKIQVLILKVA